MNGESSACEFYNKWNQGVERTVPKERLLKFNVKEGWEPLCKFLGVPIPDVPFPNMNSGGSLEHFVELRKRRSWLLLYELITLPLFITMVTRGAWNVCLGDVINWCKNIF